MRALDAYCCAGGTGVGLARAGFVVTGVDIAPRVEYPFPVHRADAVEFIRDEGPNFDLIVAGPPCQSHSTLTKGNRGRGWTDSHTDLIAATRDALVSTGRPWIIENVSGARPELRSPILLCGLMFGLKVFRHRLFESNMPLTAPEHPSHTGHRVAGWRHGVKYAGDMFAVYGDGGGKGTLAEWQAAMDIDWITDRTCLAEAIPPPYSDHLGRQAASMLADCL